MLEIVQEYGLHWRPVVGDDTDLAWLTVGLYFAAAIFSCLVLLARRQIFSAFKWRQYVLWGLLVLIMIALGLNKQLDIQTLLTEAARYVSREYGWCDQRKTYQLLFIGAVIGFSVFLVLLLLFIYRHVFMSSVLVIIGLGFLLSFIAVRAASFHGFDHLINDMFMGYRVDAVLEIPGIVLIIVNALALLLLRPARSRFESQKTS